MSTVVSIKRLNGQSLQVILSTLGQPVPRLAKSAFTETRHYSQVARQLGLEPALVYELVEKFRADGTVEYTLPETTTTNNSVIFVRGIRESTSTASRFDDLLSALNYTTHEAPEPVISWGSDAGIIALDVDYRFDIGRARQLLLSMRPTPEYSWVTHGGGLRAIYKDATTWTAKELAAVAAFWIQLQEPLARVELKTETRHPAYKRGEQTCSEVIVQPPDYDTQPIARLLGSTELDPEQLEVWLEAKGLTRGLTYDHQFCPINPTKRTRRPSVFLGDSGIFCHVCAADGRCYGASRRPGYVGFRQLLGDPIPSALKECVRHFGHYTHAEAVMNASLPTLKFKFEVYAALLKTYHGDDPRVQMALHRRNFLRIGLDWRTTSGEYLDPQKLVQNLSDLPAFCYLDQVTGEVKVDKKMVEMARQRIDLKNYGYPTLSVIRGFPVYTQFLPPRDETTLPIVLSSTAESRRPKYLAAGNRPSLYWAWKQLQDILPGCNRKAVYLLIAAKALQEAGGSPPSILFFEGASGVGKSQTAHLAASIMGDVATEAGYKPDRDYIYRSVAEASERGSIAVFNEVIKHAKESSTNIIDGMDFLLNLTPDQTYHKLWVGPTILGRLPVICLTDTSLPTELAQDKQLARRIIHIYLGTKQKNWDTTLLQAEVYSIQRLRMASESLVLACNTILSCVIDRWFRSTPCKSLTDIAKELGFRLLAESETYVNYRQTLRDLFRLWVKHPYPTGTDAVHAGPGCKVLDERSDADSSIGCIWSQLHDANDWTSWTRCNAEDWQRILGYHCPVECIVKPLRQGHRSKVKLGFRETRSRLWVTEMGVDRQSTPSVDGYRDSESTEFEGSWIEGIPRPPIDSAIVGSLDIRG